MIDVDEAAEILGYHRNTVYRLAHAGDIPSIRVRRRVLFEKAAIEAWITDSIDRRGDESA